MNHDLNQNHREKPDTGRRTIWWYTPATAAMVYSYSMYYFTAPSIVTNKDHAVIRGLVRAYRKAASSQWGISCHTALAVAAGQPRNGKDTNDDHRQTCDCSR